MPHHHVVAFENRFPSTRYKAIDTMLEVNPATHSTKGAMAEV
jgi:hypothetical protein